MDIGCLPLKVGFNRSVLDMMKIRFLYPRGRDFQIRDFPGKTGRLTEAGCNKMVIRRQS